MISASPQQRNNMDSELVRNIQVFFRALCEFAPHHQADESRRTTLTCVKSPYSVTTQGRPRSRSPTSRQGRDPTQPVDTPLELLKALASTHLDTTHPYLRLTTDSPTPLLRSIYQLLVYGEALFLKHQGELLSYWEALAQSHECDVAWDTALLAALMHSFACALRELHDITDDDLPDLLRKKREFWEVLANDSLLGLRDVYMNEHPALRNLILDLMIVASQASAGTFVFYKRRAEYLLNIGKMTGLYKLDISGVEELENLLANGDIKGIYLSICQTDVRTITNEEYIEAMREFYAKMFVTELKMSLIIYGVTLTGKQVIIDDSEPEFSADYQTLLKAYRILILMHEFAHFLLRVSTRTFSEFMRCSTPSEYGHLPPPLTMTRVRQIIQDNFPIDYHGEAGTMFEVKLFGAKVEQVNVHAAVVLMDMAKSPIPVAEFAQLFKDANAIPVKRSQKMGLERGESINEREVMVLGTCGMPQPPRVD